MSKLASRGPPFELAHLDFSMQEASTTIKSQAQAQALAAKEESHQSTLACQEVGSDTENALPASITSASVNPVRWIAGLVGNYFYFAVFSIIPIELFIDEWVWFCNVICRFSLQRFWTASSSFGRSLRRRTRGCGRTWPPWGKSWRPRSNS